MVRYYIISRPVQSTPKSAYIRNKIAKKGQNFAGMKEYATTGVSSDYWLMSAMGHTAPEEPTLEKIYQ